MFLYTITASSFFYIKKENEVLTKQANSDIISNVDCRRCNHTGPVCAGVAELADVLDLGSSVARRMSSSLFARTNPNAICGSSSVGRAPPCQGGGRESESRLPLHFYGAIAKW